MILWIAVGILFLMPESRAFACYTGLTVIPTAEVLDHGEYGIEQQFDGVFPVTGADTRILNTEFGILPGLEAGVDFDLSDGTESNVLLNAKYLIRESGRHRPALAVGICNAGNNVGSSPYLVATADFSGLRGHLGIVRTEGRNRWFIGSDRAINDRLTIMADYVSGSDNSSSAGFSYQLNDRFGVLAGAAFPNARGERTGFTLHLVLNGPFSNSGREE